MFLGQVENLSANRHYLLSTLCHTGFYIISDSDALIDSYVPSRSRRTPGRETLCPGNGNAIPGEDQPAVAEDEKRRIDCLRRNVNPDTAVAGGVSIERYSLVLLFFVAVSRVCR